MKRPCRGSMAYAVRLLLLLALWPGPVVQLHSHGTLANAAADAVPALARHLSVHHAGVSPFANMLFGFHVHFGYPDSDDHHGDGDGRDEEGPSAGIPRIILDKVADPIADGGLSPWSALAVAACLSDVPSTMNDVDLVMRSGYDTGGFYEHFCQQLALPLRLGVARC